MSPPVVVWHLPLAWHFLWLIVIHNVKILLLCPAGPVPNVDQCGLLRHVTWKNVFFSSRHKKSCLVLVLRVASRRAVSSYKGPAYPEALHLQWTYGGMSYSQFLGTYGVWKLSFSVPQSKCLFHLFLEQWKYSKMATWVTRGRPLHICLVECLF